MYYEEFEPPQQLKDYVMCFWALEHDYRDTSHSHEHLWADTHTELIFTEGAPYFQKTISRTFSAGNHIVIGPFHKGLTLYSDGLTRLVAARLQPWATSTFMNIPPVSLINSIGNATELLTLPVDRMVAEVANKAPQDKYKLLSQYMLNTATLQSKQEFGSRSIIEAIAARNGIVTISQILTEFEIDARKLERVFLAETGMTAKTFAKITRFNHARQLIEQNPALSLSELAYETGYADQSHFIKNFKELFSVTPSGYRRKRQAIHDKHAD